MEIAGTIALLILWAIIIFIVVLVLSFISSWLMEEVDDRIGVVAEDYAEFNDTYCKECMHEYYDIWHACCPECGSDYHTFMTYIDYPFVLEDQDKYRDKNICVCEDCGYRHLVHERCAFDVGQALREMGLTVGVIEDYDIYGAGF